MHRLDPTTTVLTAALAMMTALALSSETPLLGSRGRARPADAPVAPGPPAAQGWVALGAVAVGALPAPADR